MSKAIEQLKKNLKNNVVYRRCNLVQYTNSIDRHLALLVKNGFLKKLNHGLYMRPKHTAFGEAPPDENNLLSAFLKDDHFVVFSPNNFNALGLGTTQLYNFRVVFNRKRHGELKLGEVTYQFYRWREAPKKLTKEFLVVELLNRLDSLAEDSNSVLSNLSNKLVQYDKKKLMKTARHFGTYSAQLKLTALMELNNQ